MPTRRERRLAWHLACLSLLAADKKGGLLMDFASMSVKRIHILRIDSGEDVLKAVK